MNISTSTTNIKNRLVGYLNQALPVQFPSSDFNERFQNFLKSAGPEGMDLVKEPLLELAQGYKSADESLATLAKGESGQLHPDVARAFANYLLDRDDAEPSEVHPYEHQKNSLCWVNGGRDHNLVVCTGTGSGKTECFLLPIANAIYREHLEKGESYEKHVRALILYPMNALVNDQIRRLRKLLKHLPQVTFGRFTGETDHKIKAMSDEEAFRKEWDNFPAVTDDSGKDEASLCNEYRYRSQWDDGGADILVTNFAMLERLLLLPETKLFDHPWKFIVLDEAHSYSGSSGTEIAWLIRRLQNRLPNGDGVQFLATSATLSTGDDAEEKARQFAAGLFPANADTFNVQLGTPNSFPSPQQTQPPDREFFKRGDICDLYGETIQYEAQKADFDSRSDNIQVLRELCAEGNNGATSLRKLVRLAPFFKDHAAVRADLDGKCDADEIEVTDAISWLCRLTFTFAKNKDDFRYVLHDELDAAKSESDDGNDFGNRLKLLGEWERINKEPNAIGTTAHWETVAYLYQAIETLIQPEVRIGNPPDGGNLQTIEVQVCPQKLDDLKQRVKSFDEEENRLSNTKNYLDSRWRDLLDPNGDVKMGYRERIYNALRLRPEIASFLKTVQEGKGHLSTTEIARRMWPDDERPDTQTLGAIIELGALAVPKGTRRPLIDVRFHQVMRDVADVGVYFKDGNPFEPVFVRSIEEFSKTGEKILSLGVCRRCGQPYLLGYAEGRMKEQDCNPFLFRNRTGRFTFLHAFVLADHSPENALDDFSDPKKQDSTPRWLNLFTGEVSSKQGTGSNCRLLWLIAPKAEKGKSTEFIQECKACGNKAVFNARYGIVTPYEASGTQYKVRALEAFGAETAPDVNQNIRESAPAEGRKVLAFSDSRAAAAGLAYSFDTAIETEVCDDIVLELCVQYSVRRNDFKECLDQKTRKLEVLRSMSAGDLFADDIENLERDVDNYKSLLENPPTIDTLVISGGANKTNKTNLYEVQAKCKHCERLLEYESDDGTRSKEPEDKEVVAKFRVLKALLGGSRRRGLIPDGLVKISSQTIRTLTRKNVTWFDSLFQKPFDAMKDDDMRELLQSIYRYLIQSRDIMFDVNHGDWDESLHKDFFEFERDPFCAATVTTTDMRHPVYRIAKRTLAGYHPSDAQIGHLLGNIWDLFVNTDLVTGTQDEYRFRFTQLCRDLVVEQLEDGKMKEKALPFVIQEHTAQIKARLGAVFQRGFSEGKVNILSCSTTFEMGVDVGSLNNVFLGNMPPSPSNYRQRAGRAGRRPGASPFILTLCNSQSSHDRHYWDNPDELFCGDIEPPRLYLDRPQFAARHFRAEALHDFLRFIQRVHGQEETARKWNTISHFIVGRKSARKDNQNEFTPITETCCNWLEDWKRDNASEVQASIETIHRYKEDFSDHLPGGQYDAVDDVIFQLTGEEEFCGKDGRIGFEFFRDLCGCHLPEFRNDRLQEHPSFRRKALREQLLAKLWLFRDDDGGDKESLPDNLDDDDMLFPKRPNISLLQAILLEKQTISVLSEACILPRYGFPVDTIELKPLEDLRKRKWPKDDTYKRGEVELSRPVQQGMFEYADGQSVYANKLRYESRAAKTIRYPGALHDAKGCELKFCRSCEKAFAVADTCPCCGGPLIPTAFTTPEVFLSNKGTSRPAHGFAPRGKRIVIWSGSPENWVHAPGLGFFVTEPSERFIQYINSGHNFEGFKGGKFYLHEAPTNIAIWKPAIGAEDLARQNGWDNLPKGLADERNRTVNAYLSALYALRKAMAVKLSVQEADIGCLLHTNDAEGIRNHWLVFYDSHTGGGSGCVLDLLLSDEADMAGADRLRRIIKQAKKNLEECSCGDGDSRKYPVPQKEWLTASDRNLVRRRASCQNCLRSYDNQFEHDRLDRFDALVVLDSLLEMVTVVSQETDEADEWVDFDPANDHLIPGQPYLTNKGEKVKYNPLTQNLTKTDVVKKVQQKGN